MAKKAYDYTVLSNKGCNYVVRPKINGPNRTCNRLIKKRLVEQKAPHKITKCFKHRDK
jgi:hypothetical protein